MKFILPLLLSAALLLTGCGLKRTDKITEIKNTSEVKAQEGICGMWVSTVGNIDFPSEEGLSEKELKNQIDGLTSDAAEYGINAIFLQVRPCSDAVYPSGIFPSSAYITGKQGDPLPFDILEYFITSAHSRGIQLHAWINPYRVTVASEKDMGTDLLASSNPAVLHPDWVVCHSWREDGKTYYACFYNPGLPEVRRLICDGVREILDNYEVDGIHFDDYFYPYGNGKGFDDDEAFAQYGNGLSLEEWRRENVNALIEDVHGICDGRCVFGVSPCGVWAAQSEATPEGTAGLGNTISAYNDIYADVLEWIDNGRIDYVCPQLYWSVSDKAAPFKTLADWWNEACGGSSAELYLGIGAYRGSERGAFAEPAEIREQIDYANSKENCRGVIFFSYKSLKSNLAEVRKSVAVAGYYFVGE